MIGSLSLGFRTLAIQKRSSEAWQVLGQVKNEFEKSATVWEKMVRQLQTATKTAEDAGVRHRAIGRTLRSVEAAPLESPLKASIESEELFPLPVPAPRDSNPEEDRDFEESQTGVANGWALHDPA